MSRTLFEHDTLEEGKFDLETNYAVEFNPYGESKSQIQFKLITPHLPSLMLTVS